MIYIIEFFVKILDVVLDLLRKRDEQQTIKEYNTAADNPRDFFDDGVLNNSDTATTSTVSKTSNTTEPK